MGDIILLCILFVVIGLYIDLDIKENKIKEEQKKNKTKEPHCLGLRFDVCAKEGKWINECGREYIKRKKKARRKKK